MKIIQGCIASIFLFFTLNGVKANIIITENFTSYLGTSVTVPAGWYFSYNGNYTSATYSGTSGPNSYKFGTNNATIVTPAFTNADSVSFWIKGAGTDAISAMSIYETSDSVTWTTISFINPLPTSGTKYKFHVLPNSIYLKFVYTKSVGNLAFDDFKLWNNLVPSPGKKIIAYFNNPVNTAASSGTNAVYLNHKVDDTLIAYINRAKYKIDAAIYNFIQDTSLADIAGAINNAYTRGVKIRWIYDGTTSNTGLSLLSAGINKLVSPTTSAYTIMHNKFFVIDGTSPDPNEPIVWTGSTNTTPQQMNYDVNNVIILQDLKLAQAYTTEFNEMWGDTGMTANAINSKFGKYKKNNTPHTFNIGGMTVEQYFSPSDSVNAHIQQAISSANTELYFGIFKFTVAAIGDSIKNKIQQGVYAAGIMDQGTGSDPPHDTLGPLMGNMLQSYTNGGLVYHNKLLIVDACDIYSDPLVLTGSHNWTAGADKQNDENTLIIHDATIANIYYQSFSQNFKDLGGTLSPCAVTSLNEVSGNKIGVYPNPSDGRINLKIEESENFKMSEAVVYNVLGERIFLLDNLQISSSSNFPINLGSSPDGIYFLTTTIGGKHFTSKLIIQH